MPVGLSHVLKLILACISLLARKKVEFALSHFPADILDLILSCPSHSYLAINLWKTGDRQLVAKLSSGLTYLCLTAKPKKRKPLPQLLGSLHALHTLKLTSHKRLVNSPNDWLRIISSLPTTLKALIIDSEDSNHSVRNYAPDWSESYEYVTTEYKRGPSNFIDLGTLFPRLETLVLKGYRQRFHVDYDEELGEYERSEDLQHYAGVPDTVTHLGLPDILCGAAADSTLASMMPPSLTFLDTHLILDYGGLSLEEIKQDWDGMTNLEKITSLEWLYTDVEELGGVSWLPRTLKHVTFDNMTSNRRNPESLSVEIAQTLPPALESFYISSFDPASFSKLKGSAFAIMPQNLTELTLNCSLPYSVTLLPRTLTSLKYEMTGSRGSLNLRGEQDLRLKRGITATHKNLNWPPLLTSIEALIGRIDKGLLSLLPRTLTNLKLRSTHDIALDGRELPPGLKTFSLDFNLSLTITAPLPASLTHFTTCPRHDGNGGLSPSSISMLPPSLTHLDSCMNFPKHESGVLRSHPPIVLPPKLVFLKTNEFHIDWFSALPRSLRHLTVYIAHGTLEVPASKVPTLFSGLPPQIETIDLNAHLDDDSYHWSHEDQPLEVAGTVPAASFRSLPLSLRSVSIPFEAHKPGDNPFPDPSVIKGWDERNELMAKFEQYMNAVPNLAALDKSDQITEYIKALKKSLKLGKKRRDSVYDSDESGEEDEYGDDDDEYDDEY